ncbi:hypothetical protein EJB05_17841, partial [Eragrostis curvula]
MEPLQLRGPSRGDVRGHGAGWSSGLAARPAPLSILLYSPLVFRNAGMASNDAALGATVAVGVVKTCFILVATLLADRAGRRPLLLASTAGVAAALVSVALTLCPRVVGVVVASDGDGVRRVGAGLRGGVLGSPWAPKITGPAQVTCALVSVTFISLANWITMAGCFFLYAGPAVAACMFVYVRVPETKGRRLEDMDVLFDIRWIMYLRQ